MLPEFFANANLIPPSSRPMNFLLDENVHHGLIPIMKKMGHHVQIPPKGITNGKVTALAVIEKRILITHDKDFAGRVLPPSHPGIILIRIPPRRIDILASAIKILLTRKPAPDDFFGKTFFLSESGFDKFIS